MTVYRNIVGALPVVLLSVGTRVAAQDAGSACTTASTYLRVDPLVSDVDAFYSTAEAKYGDAGLLGDKVFLGSGVMTFDGDILTYEAVYGRSAVESEGLKVITTTQIVTQSCQDPNLPPSPTASVGCEPHGDHWHCDGPAPTGGAGDDNATESQHPDLPPSPTASVGCEPHGDHWHCEGPAPTGDAEDDVTSSAPQPSEDADPSPTASVGCEPHGDHWHCEGPAPSGSNASGSSAVESVASESQQYDLPSAPTASVGCEPHGDHWHCEGPVIESETVSVPVSVETEEPAVVEVSGASKGKIAAGIMAIAALLAI